MSNSQEFFSRAKSHFAETMNSELKSFKVPELDNFEIFYRKGTNFKQEGKVLELQQAGKTAEALVQMVINRALTEEGKKLFSDVQREQLMRDVAPEVIIKIVNALNEEDEEEFTVEKAKKS